MSLSPHEEKGESSPAIWKSGKRSTGYTAVAHAKIVKDKG